MKIIILKFHTYIILDCGNDAYKLDISINEYMSDNVNESASIVYFIQFLREIIWMSFNFYVKSVETTSNN